MWLTQEQIANLFGTKRPAITKHLANIYKSGELEAPGCGVCPYCRGKKKASVIDFEMVGFSNKDIAAMNGKAF